LEEVASVGRSQPAQRDDQALDRKRKAGAAQAGRVT